MSEPRTPPVTRPEPERVTIREPEIKKPPVQPEVQRPDEVVRRGTDPQPDIP